MYGSAIFQINTLRCLKAKEQFQSKSKSLFSAKENADLSLLPPCSSSLLLHIKRANYQTFIWKQSLSAYPGIPSPEQHGWKIEGRQLLVNWGNQMLPQELKDILTNDYRDSDSACEEEESFIDFSDSLDENTDEDE